MTKNPDAPPYYIHVSSAEEPAIPYREFVAKVLQLEGYCSNQADGASSVSSRYNFKKMALFARILSLLLQQDEESRLKIRIDDKSMEVTQRKYWKAFPRATIAESELEKEMNKYIKRIVGDIKLVQKINGKEMIYDISFDLEQIVR